MALGRPQGHRPTFQVGISDELRMKMNTRWLLLAMASGVPLAAFAHGGATDPAATALRDQSAFSDYRSTHDLQFGSWLAFKQAVRPKLGASAGHGAAPAYSPTGLPPVVAAPRPSAAMPEPARGGMDNLESAGYTVNSMEVSDPNAVRKRHGIPDKYGSCHMDVVGGYAVKGRLPTDDIKRLLA